MPQKKGWDRVGVNLPSSVADIITAAGGDDPDRGGMPFAMASIIGALPWIAVAVHEHATREQYDALAKEMLLNLELAAQIICAENPRAAFDAAYEQAKRAIN